MVRDLSRLLSVAVFAVLLPVAGFAQFAEPNVNMVAGTTFPDGDQFLRQQNEPSIAVSTRNPMHLLAGANDYRSVDINFPAGARPDDEETGDAWLGVFKSFDGGSRWISTLHNGYPQQNNLNSPLNGYQAAADPVVRAGNNGMFYYAGIVLNRGTNPLGGVFVSRFIDNNNSEVADPIAFINTKMIDQGTAGQFIDKPWLFVSPANNGLQCTVNGQTFPAQNIYLAYSVFVGNDNNIRSKIMFTKSSDCGATWTSSQKLSETFSINQGVNIAVDPANANNVYVIWRRFATNTDADSLIMAKSTNGGGTFSKGVVVTSITAFEQSTGSAQIRTKAYPASAVDGSGRVHIAWSQRDANGDGRIVLITSTDGGTTWSQPRQIDNSAARGHQFMPTMAFTSGKLTLAWYDLRQDHTIGTYTVNASGAYVESSPRLAQGNLAAGPFFDPNAVFWNQLADYSPTAIKLVRRHTLDIRVAEYDPASPNLYFPSVRATRFKIGTVSDPDPLHVHDLQVNPPNLPMFHQGTVPFMGDYIDLAAYQNAASGNAPVSSVASRVRHVVWTDNRDVRPPLTPPTPPDWTKYTPANAGAFNQKSVFDPNQNETPCDPSNVGFVASRNQNIYTTRVTDGLFAGSPGNAKPLGVIKRAFAVFAENARGTTAAYRLTIAQQPANGTASFLQFGAVLDHLDVTIPAHSTATRTVFVTGAAHTRVDVNVREITQAGGVEVSGGLSTQVPLNPDITNPDITNPDITNPDITNSEVFNPDITNPDITNPDITNPDITNPDITNPDITNPDITNPDITNPDITNPDITNPDITNPDITNPDITNPDITNQSVTDTTWSAQNHGNTTGGFTVKLLKTADLPPGVKKQLVVSKIYDTPIAHGCTLGVEHNRQVVANINDPNFATVAELLGLQNSGLTDSSSNNATLWLAPGQVGRITVRLAAHAPGVVLDASQFVTPVVIAQSVNTADANGQNPTPSISLTITTLSLPDATSGQSYNAPLQAIGGTTPYTWTATGLPPGLSVSGSSIVGSPQVGGTFSVTITVTDSANPPHVRSRTLPLQAHGPLTFVVTNVNDTGAGSLRQAISDANANAGFTDKILFNIAGAAPHVITPASQLPAINDPVVIDATPAAACNGGAPSVEVDGVNAAASYGFNIAAGGTTIRGLAVTRFGGNGISITAGNASSVQCSYVGLSTDGSTAKGNLGNGIYIVGSSNNTIGGAGAARNIISGNGGEGIRIDDGAATGNVVQGNYIGTNALGTIAVANTNSGVYLRRSSGNTVVGNVISGNAGFAGVAICGNTSFCGGAIGAGGPATANIVKGNLIGTDSAGGARLQNNGTGVSIDSSANNVIGGSGAGDGNVIAASGLSGVHLFGVSPDGNTIRGNAIGTDATGTLNFGNKGAGVLLDAGSNNIIGGASNATAQNMIFFNGGAGIALSPAAGSGNLLRFNEIDSNAGLGIDLGNDGVTQNDAGDGDSGPNGLQNFPQITSVTSTLALTIVNGTLQSTPNTQFTIDFFQNPACGPAGSGQGRQWFGSLTQSTDANGNMTFSGLFGFSVAGGVTGLATAPDGSTSEFSACTPVQ